jgi:NAD(P)-dependent dehydrogenase (short-subunit alcohol dehydrogenase family)
MFLTVWMLDPTNNISGVLAQEFGRTKDNFEMDFGVNHVGDFALFQELKQCLISSSTDSFNSRVVMVASIGHRYVLPPPFLLEAVLFVSRDHLQAPIIILAEISLSRL